MEPRPPSRSAEELALQLIARADRRDVDGLLELFRPDGELHAVVGGVLAVYRGREELSTIVHWLAEMLPRETLRIEAIDGAAEAARVEFDIGAESARGTGIDLITTMTVRTRGQAIAEVRLGTDADAEAPLPSAAPAPQRYRLRSEIEGVFVGGGSLDDCRRQLAALIEAAERAPTSQDRARLRMHASAVVLERWDGAHEEWVVDHSLDPLKAEHGLLAS